MPDLKTSQYQIVCRSFLSKDDSSEKVEAFSELIKETFCRYQSIHSDAIVILIGSMEYGEQEKWHCHVTLKLEKSVTRTTLSTRLKKILFQHYVPRMFRLSHFDDMYKVIRYCMKGKEPLYCYGLDDDIVKPAIDSWVEDYKDPKTETIDQKIYEFSKRREYPCDDIEGCIRCVVDFFLEKGKGFNDFQLYKYTNYLLCQKPETKEFLIDGYVRGFKARLRE